MRGGRMGDVLFMGLTTVDIFNYVASYPASNEKMRAIDQLVSAGGPAANAAVSCSAAGGTSRLISSLGQHPLAQLAQEDLQQHGVRVIDLQPDPERLPVLSTITIDIGSGDRSVVYTDTDACEMRASGSWHDLLKGISLVMLDGYYLSHAIDLAKTANQENIAVVLDGGSWKTGIEKLLPYIDYAICSADFFPPGCTDHSSVIEYLHNIGVEYIAISRGSDSLVYSHNRETGTIEIGKQEVLDTLGAGDILHGVFCSCLLERGFCESLRHASEIATHSCMYRGTRRWIQNYSGN